MIGTRTRSNLLDRLLRAVGDRWYAGTDAAARREGLEVTIRSRGLGRTYRARLAGFLMTCPACAGANCDEYWRPACRTCGGTGRVARVPVTAQDAVTAGER
jgi:hypothetical protein